MSRFPFGRESTRRPPRAPDGPAVLAVLGVYPSALHVRWTLPDGSDTVGALAVDDEPTVFWDGSGAAGLIETWQDAVGWKDSWGSVGAAGGNGSSGVRVVEHVLRPMGVDPSAVFFTDCLPTYFVKETGSQGKRIRAVYEPFAAAAGCPPADLPPRPKPSELVRLAVENEGSVLLDQLIGSSAPRVVSLGQEAADVLAAITGVDRVRLDRGPDYGRPVPIHLGGTPREWLPLTHPGNRHTAWAVRHAEWAEQQ